MRRKHFGGKRFTARLTRGRAAPLDIAIGAFDDEVIDAFGAFRIHRKLTSARTDVAGEEDAFALLRFDFYGGRT